MQTVRTASIHDLRYQESISILIQARKAKKLSQLELAKKTGFSQPDISKIERLDRRLDFTELLDCLQAISDGDLDFFQQTLDKIMKCHSESKA